MVKYHMFSALHKLLVDDLAGIVFPGLDVNSLFHDGISTAAQSFTGTIL
jgi:hypothetical protein